MNIHSCESISNFKFDAAPLLLSRTLYRLDGVCPSGHMLGREAFRVNFAGIMFDLI